MVNKGFEGSRIQGFEWQKTRDQKPETNRDKGTEAQRHKGGKNVSRKAEGVIQPCIKKNTTYILSESAG